MTEKRGTYSAHEIKGTLIGGGVSALVMFFIIVGVGSVGSFEGLRLIEAAIPTARFLASAVLGSAVTVLALLLTLLGLSLSSDFRFSEALYTRASFLTWLSVACIILGVLVLLAVAVPIAEVEGLASYYAALYYVLAGALALLGGLVVAVGLIIGFILRGLIAIGHPAGKSDLLHEVQEEPEERTGEIGG